MKTLDATPHKYQEICDNIMEQIGSGDEEHRMAVEPRLVGEVLRQGRLADPVGTEEDHVGHLGEETEVEELLDPFAG